MAKPNYHHARKQKEQRRTDRGKPGTEGTDTAVEPGSGDTGPPGVSGG